VPLTLKERRSHWGDRAVSEYDLGNMLLGVEKALLELHGAGIAHRLVSLDTILCEKALYKLADNSMVTCTSPHMQSSPASIWHAWATAASYSARRI
jgi:hypothetical protein